jgi:hypothetical protein
MKKNIKKRQPIMVTKIVFGDLVNLDRGKWKLYNPEKYKV